MKESNQNTRETKASPKKNIRARILSPITRRILAINVLALGFLGAGILYLDEYKSNLIETDLSGLLTQAEIFAVALSEGAVARSPSGQYQVSEISNQIVRRLVQTTGIRARLFGIDGHLIADSRLLVGPGGIVSIEKLPPPDNSARFLGQALDLFEEIADQVLGAKQHEPYKEKAQQHANDYEEVKVALSGSFVKNVRMLDSERLLLMAAVPVQRYKQVLGVLLVTKTSMDIDTALYETRHEILQIFAFALCLTILLSLYLSRTIALPLRRLAVAAERVRHDHSRRHRIPNMEDRDDEIGELAATLNDMTDALWQRMDAIDHFAADVAHEIKNPLSSLRSAVETIARLTNPDQKNKLMAIIEEDVDRLDRLISDISDASRLDAELSRAENNPTDIVGMLEILTNIHNTTKHKEGPRVTLINNEGSSSLIVAGIESRLAQVFRNLMTNASTFSPADSIITITISKSGKNIIVHIDDEGPGIPPGNEKRIFERFYTKRAETEQFGTHSGLGLSISKQIIESHHGEILATNRKNQLDTIVGARFIVKLPLA